MSMEAPKSAAPLDQEEMNVYLKIVKTVHMKVKRTDTIGTLKQHIEQNQGIAEVNQKLLFDGKLLPNAQTVADSGIQNYATLHLFVNDTAAAMKLFNKIPSTNKTVTLEAKAHETTVHNVKATIQKIEGIRSSCFTLVYNGNVLGDERVLTSFGIVNNSTIHLVFSMKEVVTFYVKAQGMEPIKLSAKRTFSVGDVKALAMDLLGGGFSNDMGLFDDGQLLDDSETLDAYEIRRYCLDLLTTAPMEIVIKTPKNEKFTPNVQVLDTVKNVIKKAKKMMQKSNPDNMEHTLHYGGMYLCEGFNLAQYRIQKGSVLYICPRHRA